MFNKFLQNGTFSEHVDTVQKHHSNVAFISFAGRAEMISQGSNVALITFAGRAEMISRGFSIMRSASERLRYSCEEPSNVAYSQPGLTMAGRICV